MLTGLSSPKFNDAVQSMHTIEDIFQWQAVLDGNMEVWVQSAFQGHPSIDVGNWYFTPRQHALQDQQISFSTAIDPNNILSEVTGEEFVHTEDNKVEYYEARKEAGRTKWVVDYWCNQIKMSIIMQTLQYQPQRHTCWWYCGSADFIWRHTVEREMKQDGNHIEGDNSIGHGSPWCKDVPLTNGGPANNLKRMQSRRGQKHKLKNSGNQQPWKEKLDITMTKMKMKRTCRMQLGWRLVEQWVEIFKTLFTRIFMSSVFFYIIACLNYVHVLLD